MSQSGLVLTSFGRRLIRLYDCQSQKTVHFVHISTISTKIPSVQPQNLSWPQFRQWGLLKPSRYHESKIHCSLFIWQWQPWRDCGLPADSHPALRNAQNALFFNSDSHKDSPTEPSFKRRLVPVFVGIISSLLRCGGGYPCRTNKIMRMMCVQNILSIKKASQDTCSSFRCHLYFKAFIIQGFWKTKFAKVLMHTL